MSSTRRATTGHGVIDIEAGTVDANGIKTAGVVAEKFYDRRELSRVDAEVADRRLEDDPQRHHRAAMDRDRAYPRDTSDVKNARKRRQLPGKGEFRRDLSSRQRKDRSATKHRVVDTAPRAQIRTLQGAFQKLQRWRDINSRLREATGNAQHLNARDRAEVQRIDRLIQRYEQASGRGHVVYAVVELPTDQPVTRAKDVPETLQPGARISFDQYTMCSHNLHEAAHAAELRHAETSGSTVILEIETSRGMYLGRSDTLDDTSHLLPRGVGMQIAGIDAEADYARPGGHDSTLVVQARDTPRQADYRPPVIGRRAFRDRRVLAAAEAAARDNPPRRRQREGNKG